MVRITLLCLAISVSSFFTACGNASFRGDGCPIGYIRADAGNCVENLECLESDKCIKTGKCTWTQGICVATRPRDCMESENCAELGECHFRENREGRVGLCVASEDGCRNAKVCAQFGKCTPGPQGFCIVTSDEECAGSEICRTEGRCTAKNVERADGKTSSIKACRI